MARELFDTEPVFAETMTRCAEAVGRCARKAVARRHFRRRRHPEATTLQHTRHAQPAIFAVEMGLARLWQSWGYRTGRGDRAQRRPVLGGLRRRCVRPRGRRPAAGRARPAVRRSAGRRPDGRGVRRRRTGSSVSPTSSRGCRWPHTTAPTPCCPVPAADLERAVARTDRPTVSAATGSTPATPSTPHCSTRRSTSSRHTRAGSNSIRHSGFWCATGPATVLGRQRQLDGPYWRRHARQPVEFAKSVATLAELGCAVLLEVGPATGAHRGRPAGLAGPETTPQPIASLRRNRADHRQITEALAQAYVAGHRPDFGCPQRPRGRARSTCRPTRSSTAGTGSTTTARPARGSERQRHPHRGRPAPRGRPHRGARRTARPTWAADPLPPSPEKPCHASIIDSAAHSPSTIIRYKIRWEKSPGAGTSSRRRRGLAGRHRRCGHRHHRSSKRSRAGGHPHRIVGMPQSDADETRLEAALRRSRGVRTGPAHHASSPALGSGRGTSMRRRCGIATPSPGRERSVCSAPLGSRRSRHSVWLVYPRRATGHRHRHRVTRADQPVGILPRRRHWSTRKCGAGLADLSQGGADEWAVHCSTTSPRAPVGEDQIALRGRDLYMLPTGRGGPGSRTAAELELRSEATYLVTGGLGSVGLEIAGYLAAHGAGIPRAHRSTPATRCRAAAHRRTARPARLRDPGDRCRCRRSARRRPPAGADPVPSYPRWPASSTPQARTAPHR